MKENETQVSEETETKAEAAKEARPESVTQKKPARDFDAEYAMLHNAYPELNQVPPEVLKASVKEGKPVLAAYEEFRSNQLIAEIETLKAENAALKQNAEAASRAPVTSVSEGGSPAEEALDPFIAILGE